MNLQTLERLEKNPFYKMSQKQKEMLARLRAEQESGMVEIGGIKIHNNMPKVHDVQVIKKIRVKKDDKK